MYSAFTFKKSNVCVPGFWKLFVFYLARRSFLLNNDAKFHPTNEGKSFRPPSQISLRERGKCYLKYETVFWKINLFILWVNMQEFFLFYYSYLVLLCHYLYFMKPTQLFVFSIQKKQCSFIQTKHEPNIEPFQGTFISYTV